jgi:hypothetical protein
VSDWSHVKYIIFVWCLVGDCTLKESTGKSSVLERIAMLPLFPRGEDICTRLPIELKLQHITLDTLEAFCNSEGLMFDPEAFYIRASVVSDSGTILDETPFEGPHLADDPSGLAHGDAEGKTVPKMMQFAVASKGREGVTQEGVGAESSGIEGGDIEGSGITDECSLVLHIKSHQVPNLTLLDLPGVVSAAVEGEPANIMEKSRTLVEKYLRMSDTLVLAVIEANIPAVRNSQAIELIQRHNKSEQAIGVLTKADNCAGKLLRKLKDRLDGTAKDCPRLGRGYVAVTNRDTSAFTHGDENEPMSLPEAAQQEEQWFKQHLPGYCETRRAGGGALIEHLVLLMCDYGRRWAVGAEAKLQAQVSPMFPEPCRMFPE